MPLTIIGKINLFLHHCWKFSSLNQKHNKHLIKAKTSLYRNYSSANIKQTTKKQKIVEGDGSILKSDYNKSVWSNALERGYLYIADKSVASEVASFMCEDSRDVIVFEARPGPGILTESLLQAGIPKLRVFENEEAFLKPLETLSEQFPDHLSIIYSDIMNGHKPANKNKYSEISGHKLFFDGVPTLSWTDDIPGKFFGIISSPTSINFMRYVFIKLCTMKFFFTYGRFQFFLLVSEQEFEHLMAKPKDNFNHYRETTVFYNLFFDIEYLKKFPITSFLPLKKRNSTKKHLHMVRLTPKRDLLTSAVGKDHLPHLYCFIRHHLKRRKSYVISALEQWIPWCGPQLIKNGMQVFTRFGDLSPLQILTLFHQFSSFPEYKNSNFQDAIRNFYERQSHLEI